MGWMIARLWRTVVCVGRDVASTRRRELRLFAALCVMGVPLILPNLQSPSVYATPVLSITQAECNLLTSHCGTSINANPRDTIAYQLTVSNTGPDPASNVIVSDPLVGRQIPVLESCSPACTYAAGAVNFVVGRVPAGAATIVAFHAAISANASCTTLIQNQATVYAAGLSPVSSNTTSITVSCSMPPNLVVTTTNDPAACPTPAGSESPLSLRCAITQANADVGGASILFNIPSSDSGCSGTPAICTISPASPLPGLQSNITIFGYSQPGSQPNTNPMGSPDNAVLTIRLDGKNGGQGSGIDIVGANNVVEGLIITRWYYNAIAFIASTATHNIVAGNFVSTDGANALGNLGSEGCGGVYAWGGSNHNVIGGTAPADRNLISGGVHRGICLGNAGTGYNIIEGNYVGMTAPGTALGNGWDGIIAFGSADHNYIDDNVFSGNLGNGINISSNYISITDNLIGTTLNGSAALPNGASGIALYSADHTAIGDDTAASQNTISGNAQSGIYVDSSSNTTIKNVHIGAPPLGGVNMPNGASGITLVRGTTGTTITSTVPWPHQTFIWANRGPGIMITGSSGNSVTASVINDNRTGVVLENGASGNTIGGEGTGAGNIIAFSKGPGIMIGSSASDVVHDVISGNSIWASQGLGIDIAPLGPTCASPTPGPNDNTQCPVVTSATTSSISGTACHGCTVELFDAMNHAADYGEGHHYLGSTMADATTGAWTINLAAGTLDPGSLVTATATTPASPGPAETSEFAQNVLVPLSISPGWNLIAVPRDTGLATASGLVASMNAAGQLGSGAITTVATYHSGRFGLYVPGYSPDQTIYRQDGIFVLSAHPGSWAPAGTGPQPNRPVKLFPGWNLVSMMWPPTGINTDWIGFEIGTGNMQEVATYTGGRYYTYIPGGTPFHVSGASGLWIQVTTQTSWTPSPTS